MLPRCEMYRKICVPLMMIDNNVYSFISGIFVSLSINIFTSLCIERYGLNDKWFMYLAALVFLLTSILCMCFAARLSRFQSYIIDKRIVDYEGKIDIILEATQNNKNKWILIFSCFALLIIIGIGLLAFNFIYKC